MFLLSPNDYIGDISDDVFRLVVDLFNVELEMLEVVRSYCTDCVLRVFNRIMSWQISIGSTNNMVSFLSLNYSNLVSPLKSTEIRCLGLASSIKKLKTCRAIIQNFSRIFYSLIVDHSSKGSSFLRNKHIVESLTQNMSKSTISELDLSVGKLKSFDLWEF